MASKLTLSVSQLNEYVRRMLQLDPMLHSVELKGEISNLKFHQTGMLFFTMKDEQAAISCVMYPDEADQLKTLPFEGMRAIVTGSVTLYAKGGQYQFVASALRHAGMGVLYERLLELKERLGREGLFDKDAKRPMPVFPDTIGVVTSPTGAVIHDIINVSTRRDPNVRILLCPVRVQGAGAAEEVVEGIRMLEKLDSVSVIIVARGGGSMEDLWTFNEEKVVRAVAMCEKPVVSAVGHETDVTLCDLAADLRVPTPSAAAECVVPKRTELEAALRTVQAELKNTLLDRLEYVESLVRLKRTRLDAAHPRMKLMHEEAALNLLKERLAARHPAIRIASEQERLYRMKARLTDAVKAGADQQMALLEHRRRELSLLSPYGVLSRGYAIVMKDGAAVERVSGLNAGDEVTLRMLDGSAAARIQSTREDGTNGDEKENACV